MEELPSSRSNLLIDNDSGSVDYDYFLGGYWVIKRNSEGHIVDRYKAITDPILEAKHNE